MGGLGGQSIVDVEGAYPGRLGDMPHQPGMGENAADDISATVEVHHHLVDVRGAIGSHPHGWYTVGIDFLVGDPGGLGGHRGHHGVAAAHLGHGEGWSIGATQCRLLELAHHALLQFCLSTGHGVVSL